MNALAASPCNVGIIFTGVAILLLPFDSRCKNRKNSPKLQGIGKISAEKKENRADFCRILSKLELKSGEMTIFVPCFARDTRHIGKTKRYARLAKGNVRNFF